MFKITTASCFLALSACSSIVEQKSWAFVQSVGGFSIGVPFQNQHGWILPVHGDVSGLQTITVKPSTLNSGLSCHSTKAVIEGNAIFLTVITSVAGGGRNSACPPALLGQPSAGKYAVFYRASNEPAIPLGEVFIGL